MAYASFLHHHHILLFFLLFLLHHHLFLASGAAPRTVTISNDRPRYDITGSILPVSDGNLLQHNGTFYLYGVKYQPCPVSQQASCYNPCGYYNNSFAVWTSDDLVTWSMGSESVLPDMDAPPPAPLSSASVVYFSPFVVFNRATGMFVMWFQIYFAARAVAVSSSPFGPFRIVAMPGHTGIPPALVNGSSVYLYVDDEEQGGDGAAYMVHNIIVRFNETTPATYVSQLDPSFTKVITTRAVLWDCIPAAHSQPLGHNSECMQEGGGIFKARVNRTSEYTWFVLAGNGCCFCPLGSDTKVWSSSSPLGPYTFNGYLNPPLPNPPNDSYTPYTVPAQQFGVHKVSILGDDGLADVANLYIGMRWGSAPDGRKDHDLQYWWPIQVAGSGALVEMQWADNFSIALA